MDRRMLKRGLVALGGLALISASLGCRDRNLRVPPPAHYSDESMLPEGAYPGSAPPMSGPAAMDPYTAPAYGAAGGYDAATTPAAGSYSPDAAANPYGGGSPGAAPAAAPGYGYDYDPGAVPAAGLGVPTSAADPYATADPAIFGGTFASPSSSSPYDAADPYATGAVADPDAGMIAGDQASAAPRSEMPAAESETPTDAHVAPALPSDESALGAPDLADPAAAPPIPDDLPEMP